ncbi:DUF2807 domain-containing protein [Cryomorpha ignava]|uniref:DUF2807 domain-containing protein n=1 Tax=Cryomorpha ignava TaxID=101383 RepID=A0A7K3WQA3_9FLAO|nr:DUF2807 domain-containing protein [Cryomorpha ignava]NEN23837.1 DUF2807 domain-containing protein [Cryomorpha ignava]
MKNLISLISLVTFIIIAAASCSSPEPDSITSRTYDISDFKSLNLEVIGDIVYEQTDSFYLNAAGSSTLIDALNVSNNNGKLSIVLNDKDKFSKSKKELVIKVGSPSLESINLESIGKLHLKNSVQGNKLEITNKGIGEIKIDDCHVNTFMLTSKSVGSIEVKGSANDININMEGVGKIDCSEFKAKNAEVVSKGTGSVSVFAQERIDITLEGVGSVKYYGNPADVKTDISGIGKVERMD